MTSRCLVRWQESLDTVVLSAKHVASTLASTQVCFLSTHRVSDSSETRPQLPTLIHPPHDKDARCGCRSPACDPPRSVTNSPCWTFTVPEMIVHSGDVGCKFLPVRPWNMEQPSLPSQTRCRVALWVLTHIYNVIHTCPPPPSFNFDSSHFILLCFCHLPPNLLNPPRSPILMRRRRETTRIEGWCWQRFLSRGCG